MALGIDGLISGIKTTEMITELMKVEARPQALLKQKVETNKLFATALQNLNSKIASLTEAAGKIAKPAGTERYTAVSGSDSIKATVKTGAAAGSLDLTVNKLATAQVSLSGAMAAWPNGDALSISVDGAITELDTAGKSMDEVISTVNKANLGVTAVKIAAGSVDGVQQYRMQFTAAETGAAGAFTVSQNGTDLGAIRAGSDAEVTLWAGVPGAETKITSATNTFADLMPGVDITVSAVSAQPVTVAVSRDAKAISDVAASLVTGLTDVFNYIDRNSAVSVNTSDGVTKTTGGVFTGDSATRSLKQSIIDAATGALDGRSPSEIGITLTKYGTVEFDAEKFSTALAADPEKTQAALTAIASRVEAAGKAASDKYDGSITKRITSQETVVKSLNTQVEDWDRRLASRESTLKMIWSNLEVKLGTLNSQMDWLTGQLDSLSASSSKK
ncbi:MULTISPECIES: flagellar filament capping protein FliD [unclassified Arthrobacter]|uniref:flagellar filament capping protein FliD n=1 Tax=unclassified Arthrobacter TaxID=235627 RepID=UPI001D156D0E|nr:MULTISPECIES: flagellar filament capping protein FliD [unclassified Arthrobacter]MCC3276448.1 flagellar filament capping protein FliD [Arthrobacter sp. zg-Y20]MCC9178570.1 flagellar filament capping protein FliD [Arthrobacter sp. zg-Y750]MDK1316608.1 flagellar filament capping protein FliD [Arthrobacter sp. zg.Y20]MDK1328763.1 flagellar filament capping protein FliD [Arthrobacter sp. zg-Y1143]WIB06646.1 flagellar filament capping protein FliD [Arthrobacter sp. zg-Y20]